MSKVKIFEKSADGKTWFSLHNQCYDFTEITDETYYNIPDGFVIGHDGAGYPHFYAADNPYDIAELGTGTDENGNPIPYIFGALCNGGQKIYLNECERG